MERERNGRREGGGEEGRRKGGSEGQREGGMEGGGEGKREGGGEKVHVISLAFISWFCIEFDGHQSHHMTVT